MLTAGRARFRISPPAHLSLNITQNLTPLAPMRLPLHDGKRVAQRNGDRAHSAVHPAYGSWGILALLGHGGSLPFSQCGHSPSGSLRAPRDPSNSLTLPRGSSSLRFPLAYLEQGPASLSVLRLQSFAGLQEAPGQPFVLRLQQRTHHSQKRSILAAQCDASPFRRTTSRLTLELEAHPEVLSVQVTLCEQGVYQAGAEHPLESAAVVVTRVPYLYSLELLHGAARIGEMKALKEEPLRRHPSDALRWGPTRPRISTRYLQQLFFFREVRIGVQTSVRLYTCTLVPGQASVPWLEACAGQVSRVVPFYKLELEL